MAFRKMLQALAHQLVSPTKHEPKALKEVASSVRLHHVSRYMLVEVAPLLPWIDQAGLTDAYRRVVWHRCAPLSTCNCRATVQHQAQRRQHK